MTFNINDFKAKLKYGGARPSLFQVKITNPATSAANDITPFMVKAAQLPDSTVGVIDINYFGRTVKEAGSRIYQNWNVTVINDEDFKVRKALEEWSRRMNTYVGNLREFGSASSTNYKGTADVVQYGKTGNVLREYQMVGLFPISVGAIEVNWDDANQIETFQVEFAIDYWTVKDLSRAFQG
jgi:hypothetical protein